MSRSDLNLVKGSQAFLQYLEEWLPALPQQTIGEAAPTPEQTAVIAVDVLVGFCSQGALASERVRKIVEPVVGLLNLAYSSGVRHFILPQDTHEPDAVEFGAFPPHCLRGTKESETVPEIKALPFYDQMIIMEKNSLDSRYNTWMDEWLAERPQVDTFIVVGDCTDLCVYQLAIYLRLEANAHQRRRRVILPVNCVNTYDRPVEAAHREGGLPHDANLLQAVFLYHMALNGIEVVREITAG